LRSNLQVLLPANNVTGCTVAINQNLKEIALNPNLKNIVMHDWWLALCAASLGKIYFIQASTMLYRQHGSNQVGTDRNFFDKIKRVFSSKKELNIFNSSIEQAKELLRKHEHHMSAEVRNLIREYIGLLDSSTRQQFSILVKYKFRKNSILGSLRLWMMIMLK
jgi:rhamnosyltransferase